ncbi:hypothetical protein AGABI1DRAFT_110641 [Agaricus bisporus var. burnettii JB137-S8]|uniref:Uncharacterized protein n=1 Tax=Agaricus bisporus var. burnettii (strain JB137-S8 / ATCC MYA-4627 / FGSC 10392) TaxID=597362 RepID=K5WAY7_AGABU|nr:uncharacterized protein AGABI1DRAFT_110641 [Agaricus bisporus var. burnettii JB137-S8]EKM84049.1 hypothetical protein AGABI1DRAFT_110641 [Agaricus bisporus var. burnettii JB137-S8]
MGDNLGLETGRRRFHLHGNRWRTRLHRLLYRGLLSLYTRFFVNHNRRSLNRLPFRRVPTKSIQLEQHRINFGRWPCIGKW